MGLNSTPTRKILGDNLKKLMSEHDVHTSAPLVEKATEAAGLKVARSSVARIVKAEVPTNLDFVESLAVIFRKKAWQLLHPNLGLAYEAPPIGIADVVDMLAKSLSELPAESRERVAALLKTLARAPDSQKVRDELTAQLAAPDARDPQQTAADAVNKLTPATAR